MSIRSLLNALVLGGARPRVKAHLALMRFLASRGRYRFARIVAGRLQRRYSVYISERARIHASLDLKHPVGVVIGAGVVIEPSVTIFQHVTIGGARLGDWQRGNYPTIGEGTVIFAGAVLLGRINVGKNCVIGANSVVTKDVPDGATVVGAPARRVDTPAPL